jgi:phage baseplate assembly protein W
MANAASVSLPHFALPLRYLNGSALVNEQDSIDDMADCVYAICKTNPGERTELPDFGLLDMAFGQEPLSATSAQTQIEQWEPRAQILINLAPDRYDLSVVNAQVNVELVKKS